MSTAIRIPGPPELLPGGPDAVVDLQTAEGVALVQAEWRYADADIVESAFVDVGADLGPTGPPNRTYEVVPHAQGMHFDDSAWRRLEPNQTQLRLSTGLVCFNWYRVAVTLPRRVGDFDPTGATVVFEVVVDDYAEVWVDGELPIVLGQAGVGSSAGSTPPITSYSPKTPDPARPWDRGVRDQRADLGVAPQLHLDADGQPRLLCG